MASSVSKNEVRKRIHARIRKKIQGTAERPRLNIFRSLNHIYAQLIDDANGVTLVSASSLDKEIRESILAFTQKLQAKGHTVEAVDFEYLDFIVPAYYILTTAEASSNLSRYDGVKYGHRNVSKNISLTDFYCATRSEGFGWEVKRRIMLGTFVLSAGYYDAYLLKHNKCVNCWLTRLT